MSFLPQPVISCPLSADRCGVPPYVYPLYRICTNISIIDKVVKVIIIFPRPEYRLKGEKRKKKEVKEFICIFKKPPHKSAERGQLWPSMTGRVLRYPVFKNSQLSVTRVQKKKGKYGKNLEKKNVRPGEKYKRGRMKSIGFRYVLLILLLCYV